MGPIFNKKVTKKCNLWDHEQYTYALFTVDKVNNCGLEKKKKKRKTWRRNVDVSFIANQTVNIKMKKRKVLSGGLGIDDCGGKLQLFLALNESTVSPI